MTPVPPPSDTAAEVWARLNALERSKDAHEERWTHQRDRDRARDEERSELRSMVTELAASVSDLKASYRVWGVVLGALVTIAGIVVPLLKG